MEPIRSKSDTPATAVTHRMADQVDWSRNHQIISNSNLILGQNDNNQIIEWDAESKFFN